MAESEGGNERVLAELRSVRQELKDLREEQRALAREVSQLSQTFRSLATQLGIAAEPYRKGDRETKSTGLPGFA